MFNIGTHNSCKLRMKEEDSELSNDVAENTQVNYFKLARKVVDCAHYANFSGLSAKKFVSCTCITIDQKNNYYIVCNFDYITTHSTLPLFLPQMI